MKKKTYMLQKNNILTKLFISIDTVNNVENH